jgi:chemotaxis family two-component system sensor kinase Cph1
MRALINDLSVYCGISGQPDESTLIPSEAAFQRSLDSLQAATKEAGAVVTHTPLPLVTGDPSRLERLFQNLISNALKFRGPEPPRVHVSAQPAAAEWIFAVRDNGIGIEPQYAERIFRMFERLHRKEEYPGTGAGLAICKRIVEQHRGRMWVESQPGQGSTFYFALPAKAAVPA